MQGKEDEEVVAEPLVSVDCSDQPLLYTDFGNVSVDVKRRERLTCCYSAGKPRCALVACIAVLLVLAVMLPISLLVIIPDEIRKECTHTKIFVREAQIINPTESGFESSVSLKFEKKSPIPAKIQMKDTHLIWNGLGGGKLVKISDSNTLRVSTSYQTLRSTATITNATAMKDFNLFAVSAGDIVWEMKGESTVSAIVDVDVDVDKQVAMQGFNNFPTPPLINDVIVLGGSTTELFTSSLTTLTSSANIAIILGQDLHYVAKSNGIPIGIGTIPDAALFTGVFNVSSGTTLSSSNTEQYDELMLCLGRFMMGLSSPITMENFYTETEVSWLKPGLNSITMSTDLPGVDGVIVQKINMYPSLLNLVNVPFTLLLFNPIDASVTQRAMNCEIYYEDTHIATVEESGLAIVIPAKEYVVSPELSARSDLKNVNTLKKLLDAKYGLLDLYCTLSTDIGEFNAKVLYNQFQVPAYIL